MSFFNSSPIGKYDLQPGQWVILYSKKRAQMGPFQVLSRGENYTFEPCRYFVMNMSGNLLNYYPRMNQLHSQDVSSYEVRLIDFQNKGLSRKFRELQKIAMGHIKNLAQQDDGYAGDLFDPSDQTTRTAEQMRKKHKWN